MGMTTGAASSIRSSSRIQPLSGSFVVPEEMVSEVIPFYAEAAKSPFRHRIFLNPVGNARAHLDTLAREDEGPLALLAPLSRIGNSRYWPFEHAMPRYC